MVCVGGLAISGLFLMCATFGWVEDVTKEELLAWKKSIKRWFISFLTLSFIFGIAGKLSLDKTEFKAVVVYLIGKEVAQSERAEKVISIIDSKLDDWLKKIENKH